METFGGDRGKVFMTRMEACPRTGLEIETAIELANYS